MAVFAFQDQNIKWASLLIMLLFWAVLPALVSGLAAVEKRAHDSEKVINDCFVALQFGLTGFYSAILVAAGLTEEKKDLMLALVALAVILATIGLFFTRSIPKRLQKRQPHPCDPNCAIDLTLRGKLAIYGANGLFCVTSVILAFGIAFSSIVIVTPTSKSQAESTHSSTQDPNREISH